MIKIPIALHRDSNQLYITELLVEGDVLAAAIDVPSVQQVGGNYMELMTTVLGQQLLTLRKIEEIKGKILSELTHVSTYFFHRLCNICCRIE